MAESNRPRWICNPLHNRFANAPQTGCIGVCLVASLWGADSKHRAVEMAGVQMQKPLQERLAEISGAGNETRTRDPNLGKVVLYQLSYSRVVQEL